MIRCDECCQRKGQALGLLCAECADKLRAMVATRAALLAEMQATIDDQSEQIATLTRKLESALTKAMGELTECREQLARRDHCHVCGLVLEPMDGRCGEHEHVQPGDIDGEECGCAWCSRGKAGQP